MPQLLLGLPFDLTVDLLAVADALAASAVTAHVLLYKRDVRAAIGWIGLAWLSPLAGPMLYYVFGINRVARQAYRLSRGGRREWARTGLGRAVQEAPHLPPDMARIAEVGARLSGKPLATGNAMSIFESGDTAYPAMLAAIAGASRSIALASYIFRADRAGRMFIQALAAAMARGVEVRVLLDGIGSGYFRSPAVRELRAVGVPVAQFLHDWLPWRMPFLNLRNHRKLLIVDGEIGFTGGLNIGEDNLSALSPTGFIRDVHFRLDGPVVHQLMQAFADDWHFTAGEVLDGALWSPVIPSAGSLTARGICSGPDEDEGSLEAMLASAISAAAHRVRIVTPYFLPDEPVAYAIYLAALRGVDVDIVVPARSNHFFMDWAMSAQLAHLAGPHIAIHLAPPPFDHSKLMIVDDMWCALGSANWDVRSSRLNFEFMLECYDADLVQKLDSIIRRRMTAGQKLTLRKIAQRGWLVRIRDAAARLLLPYL